tara:strand:+ start:19 stop:303 length:285 start_codon:yes stop_codon:yes gene_type:complete
MVRKDSMTDFSNDLKHHEKGCCKARRSTESALDKQVGGSHYKNFKIQPIEFITANNLSFIQASIIKYICRYDKKNGKEDIDKAIHYCELLKELK